MAASLTVIHVEDTAADSELVQRTLRKEGLECSMRRVATLDSFVEELKQPCDLILSDFTMPCHNGLQFLELARKQRPDVPFIFVSGTIRESVAVDSLRQGASDYVLKDRMWQLPTAVRHALKEAKDRAQMGVMASQLRATRKLATVATISGGLVHDFRNMLQIFKMNLDLLSQIASAPAEVKKITEQLNKMTLRGCDMTQEFLVFAHSTESHLREVDLDLLIGDSLEMLLLTLPANVKLQTNLTKGRPKVNADAGQIDRILLNLVRNASDAMPKGGNISVTTDMVRFNSPPDGHAPIPRVPYIRVTVSDTGSGMDEATRLRIFEPFFTTKSCDKGTGFGLPMVLSLVEAHNGFIDVHSEVGKGTTFSLFFPTLPSAVEEADATIPKRM